MCPSAEADAAMTQQDRDKEVDDAARSLIGRLTTSNSPRAGGRSRSRGLPGYSEIAEALGFQIDCTEQCCLEATAKDCAVGSAFHAVAKATEVMAQAAVQSGAWAASWVKEATEGGLSAADEAAVHMQVVKTIVHRERCEDAAESMSRFKLECEAVVSQGGVLNHDELAQLLHRSLVHRAECRAHIHSAEEMIVGFQVRREKLHKHAAALADLAGEDPLHMEPALSAVAMSAPAAIRAMKVVEAEVPQVSDYQEALARVADATGTLTEMLGGLLDTLDDLDAWEDAGQLKCLESPQAVRMELEELHHTARQALSGNAGGLSGGMLGFQLREADRVLQWSLSLQLRVVKVLRSLPDPDTLVQTCVAARQRQQLRDAAAEYCRGQPEKKTLKGFLRWFHSDYSDRWFEHNLPRLCDSFHQVFEDAMRDEMLQSMLQQNIAAEKLKQMLETQLELLGTEASELESTGGDAETALHAARGIAAEVAAAAKQAGEWAAVWAQRALATLAPKQAHEDEASKLDQSFASLRRRIDRTTQDLHAISEELVTAAADRRPCDMAAARKHVERAIECRKACREHKAATLRLQTMWHDRSEELRRHLLGLQSLAGASTLVATDPAADGLEALAKAAPLGMHVIHCCRQESFLSEERGHAIGSAGRMLSRVGIQDILLATRRSHEALGSLGEILARLLDTVEELDGWDVVPNAVSAPSLEVPQALRVETAVLQDDMKRSLATFCKNMPQDKILQAVNRLERAWQLQQRLVLLLIRLPDEDTVMKRCVAAQQRGRLRDAAREYCQTHQQQEKSLKGFLRWFHREYSDDWFQRNLPRFQEDFPEVYHQACAEHEGLVAASQAPA